MGRRRLGILFDLVLEVLLRGTLLRLAALSEGAEAGASPAALLPLLVLKCWLQLTLYLPHNQWHI